MTPNEGLFGSVLEQHVPWRRLAGSALCAASIIAAVLVGVVALPARRTPSEQKPRDDLVVTFVDLPKGSQGAALDETEGSLGGSAARARLTAPSKPSKAKTRAAVPLLQAEPLAPPQDEPRAEALGRASPPETSPSAVSTSDARVPVMTGQTVVATGTSPGRGSPNRGRPSDPNGAQSGAGAGNGTGAKPVGNATTVLPFGDGMTRPVLLSKVDPVYTREALEASVQGLMLLRCVITTEGELRKCRVVKGLPFMDKSVLAAVARWRYSPVTYQGRPTTVEYVIPVRLVVP